MKRIKIFFAYFILLSFNVPLLAQWVKLNSGLSTGRLYSVYFTDDSTGYAAGYDNITGVILKTTDGGAAWTSTPININNTVLKAVYFPSDSVGYAAGLNSVVVKTTDAGNTWNLSNIGIPADVMFVSVHFINNDTGYIGTENSGPENVIFKTTDGGALWNNITDTNIYEARSIYFVSNMVGYTIGSFFYKTTDAGNSWTRYPVPEMEYFSLQFLNDTMGFAAGIGASFPTNYGTIIKTTDGGITWYNQVFLSIKSIWSLFFPSKNIGYATGSSSVTGSGMILKTIDGGTTWITQLDTGLTFYLFAVHCLNDSLCYAVGDVGLILKTTNGGGPLSTNEININKHTFSISPNPFSNFLTIEFNSSPLMGGQGGASFILYDFTGKEISHLEKNHLPKCTDALNASPCKHQEQMDTRQLSPGIYFLIANINGQIQTMKIIKM